MRAKWLSIIAVVTLGCSPVSPPSGAPATQEVTLFVNPFCPVFQRAAADFRPRELSDATQKLHISLRWRPVILNSTECELTAAKYILCAADGGDPTWVVENLATSDIPLADCSPETIDEIFRVNESEAKALSECVAKRGDGLLAENNRYLTSIGMNRVPYFAIGSENKPRRMSTLRRVLEALNASLDREASSFARVSTGHSVGQ